MTVTCTEFGHALGCDHEHQHPDTDIVWNVHAAREIYHPWTRQKVQQDVTARYTKNEAFCSQYDPQSIMMYEVAPDLILSGTPTQCSTELSDTDKYFIQVCYPFTERKNFGWFRDYITLLTQTV